MNFKYLFTDIDGTLLSTGNDVSEMTISEINRIKHRVQTILVSARMPSAITYLQKRLGIEGLPIICYNGALIMEGNKVIDSTEIPTATLEALYDITKDRKDIHLGIYAEDEWYVEKHSARIEKEKFNTQVSPTFMPISEAIAKLKYQNRGAHKIMTMASEEASKAIYPILQAHFSDSLHLYRSNATLIEIADKRISKLTAIKDLLKGQHASLEQVIAFGDNYNDVEMLEAVGFGVAVANAREEAKAVADAITDHHKEHGVAKAIAKYIP
ncbi:HAD family hydrolase [Sungkyunkwania multivorans]|uniref:HAD family hydrolase n=1 Tax=Sungkyunkwania multivorans TaxID=1173618 RepID=A0ABW3CTU4_9FLAO